MYEVVPKHVNQNVEDGSGRNLELPPPLPLASDQILQLHTRAFIPEVTCKPVQLTSVSIAVDLQPDPDHALLGNVAGAQWISLAGDMASLWEAIHQAGTISASIIKLVFLYYSS